MEAGKKAADAVIPLQKSVADVTTAQKSKLTAEKIAVELGKLDEVEVIFAILRHLAAKPDRGVSGTGSGVTADTPFSISPSYILHRRIQPCQTRHNQSKH